MTYQINFCRLTAKNRLADRFLTSQVKTPTNEETKDYGNLYCIVEILNPWQSSYQIGQSIINTLAREYYQGKSTSDLENFENALLKVNEHLASLANRGETDWIGNLNCTLALVGQEEIHLTFTGKVAAYLLREGNITSMLEDYQEPGSQSPLSTFTNLISGNLQNGDKIVFGSSLLFETLTAGEILDIYQNSSPVQGASDAAVALAKSKVKAANAIFFEIGTDLKEQEERVVYLDQPQIILRQVADLSQILKKTERFKPALRRVGESIISFDEKITPPVREKIVPQVKTLTLKFGKWLYVAGSKLASKITAQKIALSRPPFQVYDYKNSSTSSFKAPPLTPKRPKLLFLKNIRLNRKTVTFLLIIVLVILLGVLIGNVTSKRSKVATSIAEGEARKLIRQAEEKKDEAKLSLLYNEPEKAAVVFGEALDLLSRAKNNPKTKDGAIKLMEQINTDFDKLTNTQRLNNPGKIATLTSEADKIFVTEGKVFSLNKKTGEVLKTSLVDGKTEKLTDLAQHRGLYHAANFLGDKNLLLFTTEKEMFNLNLDNTTVEELKPAEGGFENGLEIATFSGNVYLLDPSSSQIWKYPSTKEGFSKAEKYLTSKVDLSVGLSFSIDGNIYVLLKDGSLLKFLKGEKQDFSLKNLPKGLEKIENPLKVETSTNSPSIYVLEGKTNRILEFDKEGNYLRSYVLFQNQTIQDFTINPIVRKMWILSGKDIFEIGL